MDKSIKDIFLILSNGLQLFLFEFVLFCVLNIFLLLFIYYLYNIYLLLFIYYLLLLII